MDMNVAREVVAREVASLKETIAQLTAERDQLQRRVDQVEAKYEGRRTQVERLTAELDAASQAATTNNLALRETRTLLESMTAERDALRAALEKYGTHDPKTCALYTSDVDPVCDCGFREALNPTSAAEGKE